MSYGRSSLLRKLIPKSYHFDGYNELNCPNSQGKAFFEEGIAKLGDFNLVTRFDNKGNLVLEYSNVCPYGIISFEPYKLSFESFVELLRNALNENSDFITFEIHAEYLGPCSKCQAKNSSCSSLLKRRPSTIMAAVSFDVNDIKNALSVYFGINKTNNGGKNIMKKMKNLLGLNIEFGMSKDRNIASTLMGVAVRNPENGNWYVYDSAKHTLTNLVGMKMGDWPVMLVPVQSLTSGDLTKLDGKYYYVREVQENYFTLLEPATGNICQKIPADCIIPGMNFYTKVVAFDPKTLADPNSKENLSGNIIAAMCLMQWSKGESEFSLDNINNDSFNGLGSCLPMLLALNGTSNGLGNMFGTAEGGLNLPLLMMMGSGNDSEESNEAVQFMILSQLLGANKTNMFHAITGTTTTAPVNSDGAEVVCPKCGKTYTADTNFCPECGTHTVAKGKTCTKCGTKLKDGATFCHHCGQKVVIDSCPKCGAKVTPDSNFCAACGAALNAEPSKAPVVPTAATPVVEPAVTAETTTE